MKRINEVTENFFVFRGLSLAKRESLLSLCSLDSRVYKKGDVIYSQDLYEPKVGFVLSGRCEVRRTKADAQALTLNVLEKYDSFGVLAVFSNEEFPTQIYAAKDCEILFFTRSEIMTLIDESAVVSKNIIEFLTDRIAFLNRRIATFTCAKAEDKLASYLLSEYARCGVEIPFNCQKVAAIINVGRASIYRALAILTDAGYIKYDTKKIEIINYQELERILK